MFPRKRRAGEPDAAAGRTPKIRAILGEVQAGKTAAILDCIEACADLCLVVVRNVGPDARQFMNACSRRGLPADTLATDKGLRALGCGRLRAPRVVVLLANAVNVRKAQQDLAAAGSPPFVLFIDEADKLAFSTEPSDRSFRAELERLRGAAREQVLVTATMFNFMTLPDVGGRLTGDDLTVLQPSAAYCGIRDVHFGERVIDDADPDPDAPCYIRECEVGCDCAGQRHAPDSLRRWVRGLETAARPPGHPVLALARMGNQHATIFKIAECARRHARAVLPVVYTGDGVAVPAAFLALLDDRGYPLKRAPYRKLRDFCVLGLPLQAFLSVVKASGALGPPAGAAVLICAGTLAGRCVNFTDAAFEWALTHEYYLPAKSTEVAELQQALRVLGNKPWDLAAFRPTVMTKRSAMRNVEIGRIVTAGAVDNLAAGAPTLRAATHAVELERRPTVRYAPNMVIGSVRARCAK